MSKSIKVLCKFSSLKNFFTADRLYKARLDEAKGIITLKCDYGVKHELNASTMRMVGKDSAGNPLEARFVVLKTKTLKCMRVIGPQKKDSFKPGKRYQIESGRALGGVAGRIFDDEGYGYTLYREDVGFSCAVAVFEAKYL